MMISDKNKRSGVIEMSNLSTISSYSTTNYNAVSRGNTIPKRSQSSSHIKNTSSFHRTFQSVRMIRLCLICAIMLVSFFMGIIVHAVSGGDEVQAASLQSESSSSLQDSAVSTQTASLTPTKQKIIVLEGDSLWTIADNHAPKGQDVRAYIQKLKQVNHLSSSALQAGQVLVLP
jgi:LysM repeat protein